MLNHSEIHKRCFINRVRFIQSVKELKQRYSNNRFDRLLQESLKEIIKIAENPGKSNVFKSKFYAEYFTDETGIALKNGNPFCMALFSKSLSINIIFVLLSECKNCGYVPVLIRDERDLTENHIVCAFDLFDCSKNESLFRIRRKNIY